MHLMNVAKEMASIYKRNEKVKAVLLAGSVSRGWQDKHSDIELHIFWQEAPTDSERMSPIHVVNGNVLDFYPYEEEEWSETYLTHNIKLEISNFLVTTIETYIEDVVLHHETNYDKQCILASIFYGHSLYGNELILDLKKKIEKYPSELAEKMILENLELGSRWNNRRALEDREDWLMLMDVICSTQKNLLGILFGLNQKYVHHPAFKWMHQTISSMEIKPNDLDKRLTSILVDNIQNSVAELELLLDEILTLVDVHYPHIEIKKYKEKNAFLRPENSAE
ncbi:DUF4037 domain-containing protein [Fictibacillus nanhaiensis]|uniref:DUF4037 domain-containing protein n=1 Tax=Fictibacillus nanhaiensis TaxID=742169 RepID=UPI001C94A9E7|nr:DUF4037 domain-containing protein [Fictibacillus nanhaiensis]MBY6037745.1 DUF4037 domain-containing protein [Fictibacillus nanhaiensis]